MTEKPEPAYERVHYAIGSNGQVCPFLDRDVVPGDTPADPPALKPDHPMAQGGVTWDFDTLHDPIRPPRAGLKEEPDEFSDEQLDAAVDAYFDGRHLGSVTRARERMRNAFIAAGVKP